MPLTTEPPQIVEAVLRPEFFRLPKKGGDPFFGLSRSTYYALERQGTVILVRLRLRGTTSGIVLVPYDRVSAYLKKLQAEQEAILSQHSGEIPDTLQG